MITCVNCGQQCLAHSKLSINVIIMTLNFELLKCYQSIVMIINFKLLLWFPSNTRGSTVKALKSLVS